MCLGRVRTEESLAGKTCVGVQGGMGRVNDQEGGGQVPQSVSALLELHFF
jgi:hypothetical protein